MPEFTKDEIKERIKDGTISAISIDTAVFDKYHCNLGFAVLARLDQFKKGGVNFVLSEIVTKEVASHIASEAVETQRQLNAALKRHDRRWRLGTDLNALRADFQMGVDPLVMAEEQVEAYVEAVGAEVIPGHGDGELAEEVLRRYFGAITPFERRETKKHEFPDAFALLGLEQAAASRKTMIVCVSPDKGWATFAAGSKHLVVVSELDELLSWFNDPDSHLAEKVLAVWRKGDVNLIDEEIDRGFEYYLDGLYYDLNAHAPLDFESEPISAVLQHVYKDRIGMPTVIARDDDRVTLTARVIAKVGFEADFRFYSYDSIDGDNVALGSRVAYTEGDYAFDVSITVAREMDGDAMEVLDVTVTSSSLVVEFGYVDPFPDEDPTHEKY